ncbi:MAG: ribulose-phosphate 3-epimerase [Dehalococcoidales bacterium]|nr:ribulose-phosphate 3-epimerase [Dehalococcoidales bacterium]
MTPRIVPAVLTSDAKALRTMVCQVEDFVDYVQFDFMDGHFVPSLSVTDKDLASIPLKFKWEAHLMVENPADSFASFKRLGASRVVFHYEATKSPDEVIRQARRLNLGVGMALNPDTPVSSILPFVSKVDNILFMTVVPGYYGSKFLPQVMEKIASFRQIYPKFNIGVDGGINANNIALVASTGVDDICVGSAIFLQPSPAESYRCLRSLAEEAAKQRSG